MSEPGISAGGRDFVRLGNSSTDYAFREHYRFFHRSYRRIVLSALTLSLLGGILSLLESFSIKSLASAVLDGTAGFSIFAANFDVGAALLPIVAAVIAFRLIASYYLDILQAQLMIQARDNIEVLVIKNLMIQSVARFDSNSIGDFIGRLATDLPRAMIYREQVILVVGACVTVAASIVFVAYFSIPLAVTIIALGVAGAGANYLLSADAAAIDRDFRAQSDLARTHIEELLRGAREIRVNALLESTLARFSEHLVVRRRPFMGLSLYLAKLKAFNALLPTIGIFGALAAIGLANSGLEFSTIDISILPPLFLIIVGVFKDSSQIIQSVIDLRLAHNSMRRLETYAATSSELSEWIGTNDCAPTLPISGVLFHNVTSSHGKTGTNGGVTNINLSLDVPGWVAVTGPSGAGKTTLVDLFVREIAPNSGQIHFLPNAIASRRALQRQISFLPQFPYLFKGKVWENLSIQCSVVADDVQAWINEPRLRNLLQRSGLERRLIKKAGSLVAGLNCDIGFNGGGWSGGEQKVLGLVRCLASSAPIVILDEPTAGLDPEAVAEISLLLRLEASARLVVSVTHDDTLWRAADRTLDLNGGKLRRDVHH